MEKTQKVLYSREIMDPTAESRDQGVVLHDLPGHHKKFSNKRAPMPAKEGSGESVSLGRLGRIAPGLVAPGFQRSSGLLRSVTS